MSTNNVESLMKRACAKYGQPFHIDYFVVNNAGWRVWWNTWHMHRSSATTEDLTCRGKTLLETLQRLIALENDSNVVIRFGQCQPDCPGYFAD